MDENAKLRKFLIRRFLFVLVLISISQVIVNGLLKEFINPLIDNTLSMEGLLSDTDIRETYLLILESLFLFVIIKITSVSAPLTGYVVEGILYRFFDEKILVTTTTVSEKVSGSQVAGYIVEVLIFFILLLVIWLSPYVIGGILFAKSVTNKVEELERKRIEKDKEFEKQRNLLLSDVAHDIKTPITTVAGFSKALADGEVPEDQRQQYLESIYGKSMQISELVSLLFEYVKLDSQGYALKETTEDFCELVRGCVAKMYTDFESKNMKLELVIPEKFIGVRVDKTQMERAVSNILVNTVKHNPEGTTVYIEVGMNGRNAVLNISDDGVAIDRDVAIHLFDPFVQGDKSRMSGSGSGLGLSITKKIVEMHGGQIRLIQYMDKEKHTKTKQFEIKVLGCD